MHISYRQKAQKNLKKKYFLYQPRQHIYRSSPTWCPRADLTEQPTASIHNYRLLYANHFWHTRRTQTQQQSSKATVKFAPLIDLQYSDHIRGSNTRYKPHKLVFHSWTSISVVELLSDNRMDTMLMGLTPNVLHWELESLQPWQSGFSQKQAPVQKRVPLRGGKKEQQNVYWRPKQKFKWLAE